MALHEETEKTERWIYNRLCEDAKLLGLDIQEFETNRAKLTLTPTRRLLKIPINMPVSMRERVINVAMSAITGIGKVTQSLRGRFFHNKHTDRVVVTMRDTKDPIATFIEGEE